MWLVILAAVVLIVMVLGWMMSSVASNTQAQAAVEAARAAQIASAAQLETARSNSLLTIMLIFGFIISAIVIGYLVYRVLRLQKMVQNSGVGPGAFGKWTPGPNAQFQRQQPVPQLGSGDVMQTLMGMMAMQMMQQQMQHGQRPQPQQNALIPYEETQQDQPADSGPWGWG